MSLWVREERFECDGGCGPTGCLGHDSKLTLQDTSDTFVYYVDDEIIFDMDLDQMQKFKDMLDSLDYLK